MIARTYSKPTQYALDFLGKQIRLARKQRKMTETDLAERVGIARATLRAIEAGSAKVEVGLVLEVAVIVGVQLFQSDELDLRAHNQRIDDRLALLPRRVRHPKHTLIDDF